MQTFFFIRVDKKYIRIENADVLYFESIGNYVRIYTDATCYTVLVRMKHLETIFSGQQFCRINRSVMVSITRITAFNRDTVWIGKVGLGRGEKYRGALENYLPVVGYYETVTAVN